MREDDYKLIPYIIDNQEAKRKSAEFIGHEIKENTELAEHETGVRNAKKKTESLYLIK
jgi:hypothetical protein